MIAKLSDLPRDTWPTTSRIDGVIVNDMSDVEMMGIFGVASNHFPFPDASLKTTLSSVQPGKVVLILNGVVHPSHLPTTFAEKSQPRSCDA
ncbi:hypothetical protein NUW54_g5343 [Trametes sanguinea]|uniref:Uncharacterized protein n=1 Tax=Trametes sanguinea TaxID=158606 RepID=A0ACC1PX03_9APHY|nr:hypothetical protein NUW54_g5343 [Trametes sanguinea]